MLVQVVSDDVYDKMTGCVMTFTVYQNIFEHC